MWGFSKRSRAFNILQKKMPRSSKRPRLLELESGHKSSGIGAAAELKVKLCSDVAITKATQEEMTVTEADAWISEEIDGGCDMLLSIADELVEALSVLDFAPPVTCVYNPLVYAREPYENYIRTYGGRRVEVLLVGMNPGPYGMAQTGVPFGDSILVKNFLKVDGLVSSPQCLHPKRPIYGFECPKREVSGQRLWGWIQQRFGEPQTFFKRFWIHNYCPLAFMEASGKNRTPDKLAPNERELLKNICDNALAKTITVLKPRLVVGIGKYAVQRIQQCGAGSIKVGEIMHPSPANPKANKDWSKIIEAQLHALGIKL